MASFTSGKAKISSSKTAPLLCVLECINQLRCAVFWLGTCSNDSSFSCLVLAKITSDFCCNRSVLPIISFNEVYPLKARISLISSAKNKKKFSTPLI